MSNGRRGKKAGGRAGHVAESYRHYEATSPMRPDVGTQPQFRKKKPPATYRYDSSLSPALDWDGQAVEQLRRLGRPFLDWTGKAERLSFDVPTLPLFIIHERLSTKAIVETLSGHRRDKQETMFELVGDPQHSIADQTLRAYEHPDEGLGGQLQTWRQAR